MIDYSNSKIYKIVCKTTGKIYIGSTTQKYLSSRLAQHIIQYNGYKENKNTFCTSFIIIKGETYEIVLIEKYPCSSKDELHARERYYIENNECVNKVIPTQTLQEWYSKNKARIKEYRDIEIQCECGSTYTVRKKSVHLKTEKHINFLKTGYAYSGRKDRKIKIKCECGCEVSERNIYRHRTTDKHKTLMEQHKPTDMQDL